MPGVGKEATPRDVRNTRARSEVVDTRNVKFSPLKSISRQGEEQAAAIPQPSLASTFPKQAPTSHRGGNVTKYQVKRSSSLRDSLNGNQKAMTVTTSMDDSFLDHLMKAGAVPPLETEQPEVKAKETKQKVKGLQKFAIIRRIRGLGKHIRSGTKSKKQDKPL